MQVVLVLLSFKVYIYNGYNGLLGSFDTMYNNLTRLASAVPIDGNRHGSYLTAWSLNGVWFGLIGWFGAFGIVFPGSLSFTSQPCATISASMFLPCYPLPK